MIEYIFVFVGLFLLVKGADYLVQGSSILAKRWGISSLIIGLTIVSFGTSLPELIVNILASISGSGDIGFGNIIGSNLANTLLILGIMTLFTNLKVRNSTIWKEIPYSFLAVFVLFIFSISFYLDKMTETYLLRSHGIILLMFFIIFLYYVFESAKKERKLKKETNEEDDEFKPSSNWMIFLMIFGGSIALFLGGKWTVDGAVMIAKNFGLSEFLISATIIAIGTSLPELVASVMAAIKKDTDMAVGNVIGSNIFNILWILGISSVITPIYFSNFIWIDILILLFVTFLLFLFMFVNKKHELDKKEGIIFLFIYLAYIIYIILRG